MSLEVFDINKFTQNQNMFIEASAGTGKTYTIQNIVSKLLSSGANQNEQIKLSNILIVTYTEKAVGELRSRIRSKIESEIEDKEKSVEDKQVFINILRQVDEAPIFTIHSFCQRTLKEFAYEANIPFFMNMATESDVENFVDKYIRDELPYDDNFKLIVKNDFATLDSIRQKLISALSLYNDDDNILKLEKNSFIIAKLSEDEILKFATYTDFNDLCKIKTIFEKVKLLKERSTQNFTKQKTCKDFLDSLEEKINTTGKINFDGRSFQEKRIVDEDLKSTFNFFYDLKNNDVEKNARNYFEYKLYFEQIPIIYKKWQEYKRENKLQTFNDMLVDVRNAVYKNENSILLERLRNIYKYAIIDEFQDTNQMQWDIFKKMFFDSNKNNIIVVGDPKQSIYSFQGADLTVYKNAVNTILTNGKGYKLDTNYRSTNEMINACNSIFPQFEASKIDLDQSDSNDEEVEKLVGSKSFSFTQSNVPKDESSQKRSAMFKGQKLKPIWLSTQMSAQDFAKLAVQKIIECCAIDSSSDECKTSLQVFDKNDSSKLRNVKFSDFAILARTRAEMEFVEYEMKKSGIPFLRYKDSNLFTSREAYQWLAVFKSIAAQDFAAYNRQILSSVLATDFFHYHWKLVADEKFENTKEEPLLIILEWQKIAKQRKWALLQERIYSDSKIEEYLSSPTQLQELAKFRQIGTYAFNFLYEQNASIEDLIQNLEHRAMNIESDENNSGDDLIARASDFDVVQVMTIHASKGLEFPVVISVAGSKEYNQKQVGPFLFHDVEDEQKTCLGFSEAAKKAKMNEDIGEEWFRLFYVAYTRASSLMILPYFEKFDGGKDKFYKTFKMIFSQLTDSSKNEFVEKIELKNISSEELSKIVELILQKNNTQVIESQNEQEIQKQKIVDLANSIDDSIIKIHSYSSLSTKSKILEEQDQANARLDKELDFENDKKFQRELDDNAVQIVSDKYDTTIKSPVAPKDFPAGAKLGNAIHKIFELYNFSNINNFDYDEFLQEDFSNNEKLLNYLSNKSEAFYLFELAKNCLIEEGFSSKLIENNYEWIIHIMKMVFNTLNALLPQVCGNNQNQELQFFALKDLKKSSYKSELEFNLNTNDDLDFRNYVTGFIDLLFVRNQKNQDGTECACYSILDWKSDKLDSEDEKNRFSDSFELKSRIDNEYSIQRVLYSYFLIQWLKSFPTFCDLSEDEIFQKHFGGIYYVLVRGTKCQTQNGVYVQTWNSFSELKKSFDKIKLLIKKK